LKILLANPPLKDRRKFTREGRCTQEEGAWGTLWPPVSLAAIGAVLEKSGHDVRIIDCAARGDDWNGFVSVLSEFSPRVVILSTGTPSIDNDLKLCSFLKERNPSIITAVFGTHVTTLYEECMAKYPGVDIIIRGEPEITANELADTVDLKGDLNGVRGITFREGNGAIIANPARPFIDDLDTLPFPAWDKLDLGLYRLPLKGDRYLTISPSRGCPYRCTFCTCQTYYGRKLRRRSVGNVLSEIEHDIERFGVSHFFFWAETFVIDKNYVRELCGEILKRGVKISWTANSRVDTVDGPLLQLMADSGCWMLSYGIESADQSVLDRTMKGTKVAQAKSAIVMSREAGIKTAGHFILGLPGDTEETIRKTIDYSMTLDLDFAQFYSAVPFPGSELYREALEKKWIDPGNFEDYRQDSAVMALPSVLPRTVDHYRKIAYRRFYLTPKSLLGALKLLKLKNTKKALISFFNFLSWAFRRRSRKTGI